VRACATQTAKRSQSVRHAVLAWLLGLATENLARLLAHELAGC